MPRPAIPFHIFGKHIETGAIDQMNNACALPVAVAGALMPDAHQGYGLPIGGVLATRNAVIPYGVGMDIACRMRLSVLDLPLSMLAQKQKKLVDAFEKETSFGVGAVFRQRKSHAVMDEDWGFCARVRELKDEAWSQLGTSGSGNHFVEFGRLTVTDERAGIAKGKYLALLSHSGSRGPGARIATAYSRLAADLHPELPRHLQHLAWLDLDSEPGMEYWRCMTLMGQYAAANHLLIHNSIATHLGAACLWRLENHHNFAWKERHGGEDVVVHRKGATPAGAGMLSVIPGSMTAPGFVVEGLGEPSSIRSAAHGAGRKMSRKAAIRQFSRDDLKEVLRKKNVTLISGGLDEIPMAYKNIETVMAEQSMLVRPVARFEPAIVKMAP